VLFDFPLAVDTARAHAFAYFLAPFVRDLVDGPVPMFVFSAPTPGTGKDLLSGGLAYPSLGHKLPTTTYDGEEAERRKTIFALLRDVPSHIAYNNVNRAMESTALKATLTQTVVEGRVLGVSEKLRLPNNAIWSATGNNVEVDAELLRRVLWVRLISDHEQPSQRSNFKHPDLMRWIASYRGELCAAALSIVSAWIAAGKPAPRVAPAPMGSFESFVSVMAGILAHAGIDGFRPVTSVAHEVSQEVRVWRVIVERWRERFPSKVVSAGELWSIVSEPEIRTALGIRDDSDNLMKAAWGRKLSKMVDRVFDGWRIKVADVTYSSNRYTLAETRVNP
jgi:hypothetical protein